MNSVVVELESHAVMDLVVLQRYVIFKDGVPLLNPNFLRASAYQTGKRDLNRLFY